MVRRILVSGVLLSAALLAALPVWAQGGRPSIAVEAVPMADGVHPGNTLDVAVQVTLDEGWHVQAHEPAEPYLIATVLTLDELPEGVSVQATGYPEPETFRLQGTTEDLLVYGHEFTVAARLAVDEGLAPGEYTIGGTLRYQACDDATCIAPANEPVSFAVTVAAPDAAISAKENDLLAGIIWKETDAPATGEGAPSEPPADEPAQPEEATEPVAEGDWQSLLAKFDVAGQASGYLPSDEFLEFVDATEAGRGNEHGGLAGQGMLAVIGIALIGGLLLNLTPCVLPLIPINLAIIGAGAKAGSKSRGTLLGGAYGLGIAAVFGALGLIFVLGLSSFGGNINASPWFNLVITVVFVLLGLAMFDLVTIDFSKFQSKINMQSGRGTMGFALVMGGVSALLAGACVAPVLAAVLLYSQDLYAEGNVFGLVLPFILGIGMALPWPIVGGGISLLPKPGAWMTKVKYVFGVVIIGIAGYYGYQTYTLFEQRMVDETAVVASVEESGWQTSFTAGLQQAIDEDKPVLVDFWATWCKNCLVMNKTTFKDEEVLARLDNYVKIKYQAEDPAASPHAEILSNFDQYVSFPFYVILTPKD